MFFFLKLILAHLIADFILQFEELYRLKIKKFTGHFYHAAIHALVSLALLFPFLGTPAVGLFVAFLAGIHLIQDLAKYALQKKYPSLVFPIYLADQILHVAVTALVFFLPLPPPTPGPWGPGILGTIYLGNIWTAMAIAFILATFAGSYTLHNFRKNYLKSSRTDHFVTSFEMIHGLIERTFFLFVFMLAENPAWFALSPLAGLLRLPSARLKNRFDFIASFAWAAAAGLLFRPWIR